MDGFTLLLLGGLIGLVLALALRTNPTVIISNEPVERTPIGCTGVFVPLLLLVLVLLLLNSAGL